MAARSAVNVTAYTRSTSIEMLKQIGERLSHEFSVNGQYVPAILAAFTARVISLEDSSSAESEGRAPQFDLEHSILQPKAVAVLTKLTRERVSRHRDAEFETLSMQVTFESLYANELHRIRTQQTAQEDDNQKQLQRIVELGTNISNQDQVGQLYRAVFRLLRTNSFVEPANLTDVVNREIAATLESVFPQSTLNSFNLMSAQEKGAHVAELVNMVLGIRVFNLAIGKGGAGLVDVPTLIAIETDALFARLETETSAMTDLCYSYADVVNAEYEHPGSISSSTKLLHDELTNRRQFVQLISQLQHEVLEALDKIRAGTQIFNRTVADLKALVGQRDSVPKEVVYPKFNVLADTWQALLRERKLTLMRGLLLNALLQFKDNIDCSLQPEDIELARRLPPSSAPQPDPADFVVTLPPPLGHGAAADSDAQSVSSSATAQTTNTSTTAPASPSAVSSETAGSPSSAKTVDFSAALSKGLKPNLANVKKDDAAGPVRLIRDNAPDFMALPLEYEGFCPWTLVHRAGLVLPGDPLLGLVQFNNKYYSFYSLSGMRDFVANPLKYIDGVVAWARRKPVLIHLLTLQDQIPLSDIAQLFTLSTLHDLRLHAEMVAADKETTAAQTSVDHVDSNPTPGGKHELNQWELRRQALKLADLTSKRTRSTQTVNSVFRAETATQVYVQRDQSTMTAVDKGTNVARVETFQAGLRGAPRDKFAVVTLTHDSVVSEGSNRPLKPAQRLGVYGDKLSRRLNLKTPNVPLSDPAPSPSEPAPRS